MRVFKLVKIIYSPRDLTMTFITAKNIHVLLEKKNYAPNAFCNPHINDLYASY